MSPECHVLLKRCGNDNKDEDNCQKTLNDKSSIILLHNDFEHVCISSSQRDLFDHDKYNHVIINVGSE